ncbi:hypothetical protein [Comamonas badia]|uniref:hypothetical protein n=1 Tax=Comamonas badia TaxID=265291 RepID=UPI0012EC50EC|nr:hypothetical protein [Comamonas badia]
MMEFACDVPGITHDVVLSLLRELTPFVTNAAVVFCGNEQAGGVAQAVRDGKMTAKHAV